MNIRIVKISYLLACVFLLHTACKWTAKHKKTVVHPIEIKIDSAQGHLSLIDNVDSLQVIELDANDLSIISGPSSIDKVIYKDKKYFLLDITYASIKVFDSTGKYLYDIGKIGKGIGEFVKVDDMIYSPYNHSLIVLSNNPNKVTEFSLDGKVIKTQILRFFAHSMALLGKNERVFYVNQNNSKLAKKMNLLFTDGENAIQERMFPMPDNFRSVIKFSGGIFSTDSGVYFTPALSPKYYLVSAIDTCMAIQVRYDSIQDYSNIEPAYMFDNLAKFKYQYSKFIRTSNYVGFNYMDKGYGSAFFNIARKQLMMSDVNIDSLNILFRAPMFQCGEHVVMVFDRESKRSFLQRHKFEILKRFPSFQKAYNTHENNPNPLLVNFTLR